MQGFNESIVLAIICPFLLKAVYRIGGKCFIVREIDIVQFLCFTAKFIQVSAYFTIASQAYRNFVSFLVSTAYLIYRLSDNCQRKQIAVCAQS